MRKLTPRRIRFGLVLCRSCGHNVLAHKNGRCEGIDYRSSDTRKAHFLAAKLCDCVAPR